MNQSVFLVNRILAILTVFGQVIGISFLVIFLFYFLNKKKLKFVKNSIFRKIVKYSYHLALIVSLTATLGSLFYSEIAGFEPCKLCWFQRILMYPMPLLLSLAIWKKDKSINDYLITLSGIGIVIAFYHYYLQRGGQSILPCSTIGYSVSCSNSFVMELGYITIPLMAATAFLLIIVLMLVPILIKEK